MDLSKRRYGVCSFSHRYLLLYIGADIFIVFNINEVLAGYVFKEMGEDSLF